MARLQLAGKVALITGGSRGLGFLLARELARRGCRVAICGRDEAALDWARSQLRAENAQVIAQTCDVSDREQVDGFVARVVREAGAVDVLVNNAGIIEVGPLQDTSVADFERAMAITFWGSLYMALACYPAMVERHSGAIVNVTSVGGWASVPHLLPYSCAKFAQVALSQGLRAELDRYGVRVLTVSPGLMRTGSYLNAFMRSRQQAEFAWFALGSALPLVSMDAERAARQIVWALEWGLPQLTLGLPANVLRAVHGLFPGLTAVAMSLVNRLLPAPGGAGNATLRGREAGAALNSKLLDMATALGRSAAERFQPGAP
ncbi:MAG TPA: SDR family oxidoreductase [Chloroflexota bacterium]|nr:SDR family oxidoreductase [Chloroflexota bacterium]